MRSELNGEKCQVMNWPGWYVPSKNLAKMNLRVARGMHPMGMRLADNGETCGSCSNLAIRQCSRRYYKCSKARMSFSHFTDVRKRWAACELWARAALAESGEE